MSGNKSDKGQIPVDQQPMIGTPPPAYSPPQAGYAYPPGQSGYVVAGAQPGVYGQPGTVTYGVPMAPMVNQSPPPDYMLQAILVTLCCFWPTGIFAILKSSNARNAARYGDMDNAHAHARSAKQMINISLIVGIICLVVSAVIMGVYIGVIIPRIARQYD